MKRCDERARECRVVRRTSALALRSALGQPECGVWGPGRLAYGKQLSARALIIFQNYSGMWMIVGSLQIKNAVIEIYTVYCVVSVTFTVEKRSNKMHGMAIRLYGLRFTNRTMLHGPCRCRLWNPWSCMIRFQTG